MWGSYYNLPKPIFYLLKGDHESVVECWKKRPLMWALSVFEAPGGMWVVVIIKVRFGAP